MNYECEIIIPKYILTRMDQQMRQKKFKIKNKLTILIYNLKLFFISSYDIKLFYQTYLIYLTT